MVKHTSVSAAELVALAVAPADGFTTSLVPFAAGGSDSLHPAMATESAISTGADR
jgi:hypothetical protein